jgi:hypothetical protein
MKTKFHKEREMLHLRRNFFETNKRDVDLVISLKILNSGKVVRLRDSRRINDFFMDSSSCMRNTTNLYFKKGKYVMKRRDVRIIRNLHVRISLFPAH